MSAFYRYPLGVPDDADLLLGSGVMADVIDDEVYPPAVSAAAATYELAGTDATLTHGHRIAADAGAFTSTGVDVAVRITSPAATGSILLVAPDARLTDASPYDTRATGYLGAYLGMMIVRGVAPVVAVAVPVPVVPGSALYTDHAQRAIARLAEQFKPGG